MKGIVAFAFGIETTANRYIAYAALNESKNNTIYIYTQKDIHITFGDVSYIGQKKNRPPSTLEMARGAVLWAATKGIKEICVVAAKPHMKRCIRDLKYASKENKISIKIYKKIEISDCFDVNSLQTRTRSPINWWIREIIIRIMPMFLYKFFTKKFN